MKVCILSDSHDNHELLYRAVEQAKAQGAEAVLHCGDVVAPNTLRTLIKLGLPVHVIHGNNTGDLYTLGRLAQEGHGLIAYYGQDAELDLAGRRVFLVHYPHYARAMATTGEWDLVCCGHTHKVAYEQIKNVKGTTTALLNPGTVGGVAGAPATYVLADLATMTFETFSLNT